MLSLSLYIWYSETDGNNGSYSYRICMYMKYVHQHKAYLKHSRLWYLFLWWLNVEIDEWFYYPTGISWSTSLCIHYGSSIEAINFRDDQRLWLTFVPIFSSLRLSGKRKIAWMLKPKSNTVVRHILEKQTLLNLLLT